MKLEQNTLLNSAKVAPTWPVKFFSLSLLGILMRSRDYRAIHMEPDFASLEQIFDQEIMIVFWKHDFFASVID